MSDGMSDSRALAALYDKIDRVAADLRDVLEESEEGHRGMTVPALDIVNGVLRDSGYRLVKDDSK